MAAPNGGSTNVNPEEVEKLRQQAEDLRTHMNALLRKTDNTVQHGLGAKIWTGGAASEFHRVQERYQTGSNKLQQTMTEILEKVGSSATKYTATDTATQHSVNHAAGNINLHA